MAPRGRPFLPAGQALPLDDVVACDLSEIVVPSYVRASGTALPFRDQSFDISFSTDVLEHVPNEDRNSFIEEMARVGKVLVLSGPVRDDLVEKSEETIQAMALASVGSTIPPLDEHAQFRLPTPENIDDALAAAGLSVDDIGHGRLDLWLAMYSAKLLLGGIRGGALPAASLDRWMNRYGVAESQGPVYRRVFIGVRPEDEQLLRELRDAVIERASSTHDDQSIQELVEILREAALAARRNFQEKENLESALEWVLEATHDRERDSRERNAASLVRPYWRDASRDNEKYWAWLEGRGLVEAAEQRALVEKLAIVEAPLVSVVVPVYKPEMSDLMGCVDSIKNQIYERWQLCLCDDGSNQDSLTEYLEEIASSDPRIRFTINQSNSGISEATNFALRLAEGEFVAFMDQDDAIPPNSLAEVASALVDDPAVDILYTDEDKMNARGVRFAPFFKPDWSPDYLLTHPYMGHMFVARRRLIEEVGGLRSEYDGSQDYDLMLRASEKARKIGHIPKVLYHWRTVTGSTAGDEEAKPWAYQAGLRALQDALDRRSEDAVALPSGFFPWAFRAKRRIKSRPLVSIIIPFRDQADLTRTCIDSIHRAAGYDNWEALLIDNQSWEPETKALIRWLQKDTKCRVLSYDREFNWSAINNWGVEQANGEIILFLNNDIEGISEGWMEAMLEHAQRSEVGAVGARLLYPSGHLQHAGAIVGMGRIAEHAFRFCPPGMTTYFGTDKAVRNYSAVTGACMMVRKEVFEQLNGFDEAFHIAYNDIDFCLRMRREGYLIVYTPFATLKHYEGMSRGESQDLPETKEMARRWLRLLATCDPYFNPNLSLRRPEFALPQPGEVPPWRDLELMLEN